MIESLRSCLAEILWIKANNMSWRRLFLSKEKMMIWEEHLETKTRHSPHWLKEQKGSIFNNLKILCPHFPYLLFYASHIQVLRDKMSVCKLFWASKVSDLNHEMDYQCLKYNMVMIIKRIILTQGEVDIFVSFISYSHLIWSKLDDFSWNDELSAWTLVCKPRWSISGVLDRSSFPSF